MVEEMEPQTPEQINGGGTIQMENLFHKMGTLIIFTLQGCCED